MKKIDKIKELVIKIKENWKELDKIYPIKFGSNNERNMALKPMADIKRKLEKELKELGIEFQCTDYGAEYCLDMRGLEVVLNAIEEN